MSNHNTNRCKEYTYQITWSPEDKQYIGTCLEFPSLSWLDESFVQTFIGILQTVRETLEKWQDKEPPPEPIGPPRKQRTIRDDPRFFIKR